MKPTPEEIDDALQAIYDLVDADDYVLVNIIEFVHERREECAEFIKNRMLEK
jgi:hypothetical protein